MKSSTLHRSGLSRENMTALESSKSMDLDNNEYSRYVKPQRNKELDMLWSSIEKPVASEEKGFRQSTRGFYILIGFIAGLVFSGIVSLIFGLASGSGAQKADDKNAVKTSNVAIIGAEEIQSKDIETTEEKYEVKSGDTLDKIAYRFYGKYDVEKIEQIQKINNITDPSSLQIGQVIIIPVDNSR